MIPRGSVTSCGKPHYAPSSVFPQHADTSLTPFSVALHCLMSVILWKGNRALECDRPGSKPNFTHTSYETSGKLCAKSSFHFCINEMDEMISNEIVY